MALGMIWAWSRGGVIGLDDAMPWHLPEDMAHFRATTSGHPVIMGRVTWDSLAPRFRPLPSRRNIVVTRDEHWRAEGAEVALTPSAAMELVGDAPSWVMGGAQIYAALLPLADHLEVTEIDADFDGDTRLPPLGPEWTPTPGPWLFSERGGLRYRFVSYRRL
ncbi:dihydrofolate reductase [Tomitella biformata]|uniref:dihydrofolate reductase n=1 Tax=Tomitella biformata TaxID=630403 RepID=UPI000463D41A|nr:dihydrofolate reductase [Tomitella biformata]